MEVQVKILLFLRLDRQRKSTDFKRLCEMHALQQDFIKFCDKPALLIYLLV